MTDLLLVNGLAGLVVAVAFLWVGVVLSRRRVAGPAATAAHAFTSFWVLLGSASLVRSVRVLVAYLGLATVPLVLTSTVLYTLFLTLALAGLLAYLLYLFLGWERAFLATGALYLLIFVGLIFVVFASEPRGVVVGTSGVSLAYTSARFHWVSGILAPTLLLPPLAGAVAYLTLLGRVRERSRRYRILLISSALLLWFGSVILANAVGATDQLAWIVVGRLLGLAAAGAVIAAYQPPRWVRERLNVESSATAA